MIKKLDAISEVLFDLLVGIVIFGVLAELIGVYFVKEKMFYSIGLFIGVVIALFMAVHMAVTLNTAMDLGEAGAVKHMQKQNLIRYGVILILFGLLLIIKIGNPLSAFLGIMGLKVAAYIQPITHKIFRR